MGTVKYAYTHSNTSMKLDKHNTQTTLGKCLSGNTTIHEIVDIHTLTKQSAK